MEKLKALRSLSRAARMIYLATRIIEKKTEQLDLYSRFDINGE